MKSIKLWGIGAIASLLCLSLTTINSEAGVLTAGKQHIGTFDGSTTFTTSSSNGINPGLFIEVRDADGRLKEYTSEDGVITVPNTKEGAYVTQAKLLGKTKYVDQDTGEILDEWEEGRNLKLESSKMPVLTTVGKNLININKDNPDELFSWNYNGSEPILYDQSNDGFYSTTSRGLLLNLEKDKTYTLSLDVKYRKSGYGCITYFNTGYPEDFAGTDSTTYIRKSYTFTTSEGKTTTDFVFYDGIYFKNIQLEEASVATPYEPYKSNILTVNELVELRAVGDVQDELNLLTGELTQRIGEVVLDGSETVSQHSSELIQVHKVLPTTNQDINGNAISSNGYRVENNYNWGDDKSISYHQNVQCFFIRDYNETAETLKEKLSKNPITLQYKLATKSVKTVDLTSTYKFNLVGDSVLQVEGNVVPTIYSITVPTEPLTFAINPNAEEGQQFIAPNFSITNESKGPVRLELKSFQQTTDIFNDVLPDEHENWNLLTLNQSKDIALALVPKASDGWLTLDESPKYVATTSNTIIGEIKPATTVDFSFLAFHGKVFDQNLSPKYQLVFTFGF